MKPILTHPTWDQIHIGTTDLTRRLVSGHRYCDYIIALARGGLVPGVLMSHQLHDTRLLSVQWSSTAGRGDDKRENVPLPHLLLGPEHTVLIVDDICDSGHTMNEVASHYEKNHKVVTASLYAKAGAAITPDIVWQEIPEDSPWIIFPWEL